MTFPAPFQPGRIAGRRLSPSASFAAFYDAAVRRQRGERLAADDLRAAYQAWADHAEATDLSFRDLRRLMEQRGHRHLKSNRMCYSDAILVEPAHYDVTRGLLEDGAPPETLVRRLDRIMASMAALRDEVMTALRTSGH